MIFLFFLFQIVLLLRPLFVLHVLHAVRGSKYFVFTEDWGMYCMGGSSAEVSSPMLHRLAAQLLRLLLRMCTLNLGDFQSLQMASVPQDRPLLRFCFHFLKHFPDCFPWDQCFPLLGAVICRISRARSDRWPFASVLSQVPRRSQTRFAPTFCLSNQR